MFPTARPALTGLVALALAAPAAADPLTWTLLQGRLHDDETGRSAPLGGQFDATVTVPPPGSPRADTRIVRIDDFALQAGALDLAPAAPVEYEGRTPLLYLQIADQILLRDDALVLARLRSGGALVDVDGDRVTFRFLELRADAGGGRAVGALPDGAPRRLHLDGTAVEIDQTFRILPDGQCSPFPLLPGPSPLPPPGGGGGVVIGGGGVISVVGGSAIGGDGALVDFESFDIEPGEVVTFVPPDGSGVLIARVTGGAPSLEDLGIVAPDGAEVSFENGVLRVASDGDLLVDGDLPELPGLTRLELVAGGSVLVTGALVVPDGVQLVIEAGEAVDIPGGVNDPGPEPIIVVEPVCRHLLPSGLPAERTVGRFELVATAAEPVAVDVKPHSRRNHLRPGSRQLVFVALLGSDALDARDVDPHSLRLGDAAAPPVRLRWLAPSFRVDVNRDRRRDLLALFETREAGIAWGDTVLCLLAETRDGRLLEGCDAVDTRPRGWRRRLRGR